jgi:hypothetical protein
MAPVLIGCAGPVEPDESGGLVDSAVADGISVDTSALSDLAVAGEALSVVGTGR